MGIRTTPAQISVTPKPVSAVAVFGQEQAAPSPPPLAADGKTYLMNHKAQVTILDARDGRVLREIAMAPPGLGEFARASIAASHGHPFIRTARKLYCVGD